MPGHLRACLRRRKDRPWSPTGISPAEIAATTRIQAARAPPCTQFDARDLNKKNPKGQAVEENESKGKRQLT